jgi:hypothetical protein
MKDDPFNERRIPTYTRAVAINADTSSSFGMEFSELRMIVCPV